MPQLDHFSFFSQVFWVLFLFTLFYFINLRYILPAVATILKVRKRVLKKSSEGLTLHTEESSVRGSHLEFFSLVRTFISLPFEKKISKEGSASLGIVRWCFHQELQNVSPIKVSTRRLNLYLRHKS